MQNNLLMYKDIIMLYLGISNPMTILGNAPTKYTLISKLTYIVIFLYVYISINSKLLSLVEDLYMSLYAFHLGQIISTDLG
jgi:hypothetical protein